MSPHPASHLLSRLAGLLLIVGLLAGCTGAAPTPEPTPLPSPTVEPSATPVPPTDTPAPTPTATPEPKPALANLRFSSKADVSDEQSPPASFTVGVPMIYAAIDATALPADGRVEWKLTRDGAELFDSRERITQGTGTLTYTLFEDARHILPGDYRLVVLSTNLMKDGHFVVSADQSPPGTMLMFDNFDDNTLDWDLSRNPRQASTIQDGQLRVEAIAAEEFVSVSASPLKLDDFDYSVTVKQEEGAAAGWVTIWFRWSSKGGYALNLYPEGGFSVVSGSYVAFEDLIEYQRHAAIKRGGPNTVRIVAQADKFAIYINDELAGTFADKKFSAGDFVLSVGSDKQGGVAYLFDNVLLTTPRDQVTLLPTPTKGPAATPRPAGTPKPAPTKVPATPPLAETIQRVRNNVEAIGGAMDRLYHGGGGEACGPLLDSYFAIVNAPEYDVAAQPANVQGAYAQYRQTVDFIASSKVTQIAQVCLQGGGTIGSLDFNEARRALNTAGSWLTQALAALGL